MHPLYPLYPIFYVTDLIDPVKDTFPQKDYKKEEDPHFFVSTNTGRGPLQDDWLESYQNGSNKSTVMCAYKLIKVEFKYWGMQVSFSFVNADFIGSYNLNRGVQTGIASN